jgi:protein-tyrosine-phosphatase
MAEAVARQLAFDVIDPSSAGLSPLGRIAESTELTLLANGYPVEGLSSKSLHRDAMENADIIINMSGQSFDGFFGNGYPSDDPPVGQTVESWKVEDPYGEDSATYQRTLEELESRILFLASRLRAGQRTSNSSHKSDSSIG